MGWHLCGGSCQCDFMQALRNSGVKMDLGNLMDNPRDTSEQAFIRDGLLKVWTCVRAQLTSPELVESIIRSARADFVYGGARMLVHKNNLMSSGEVDD